MMRNIGYIISTSTSHNHISQAHNLGAPFYCVWKKTKSNQLTVKTLQEMKAWCFRWQYLCGTLETLSTNACRALALLALFCLWTFWWLMEHSAGYRVDRYMMGVDLCVGSPGPACTALRERRGVEVNRTAASLDIVDTFTSWDSTAAR